MKINDILVEYLSNPIGIDITSPRISWTLEGVSKQDAFEINYLVNGNKRSSGKINSSSMHYDFKEQFSSRDKVIFTITIYEEEKSVTSEEHFFEIGLLNKSDWKANWIKGDYKVNKKERYSADYFKKEFNAKNIVKARLYISALGVYEASLNNQRIGDFIMAPGSTDYTKRVQYQTYDVTSLIKDGDNELNIILGDGWYRGCIGAKGRNYIFGKDTSVIAQLELIDGAGNKSLVLSDGSFSWSNDGPIRFNDFKDGEKVNNNLIPSYYGHAVINNKVNVNLRASNNEFVKEQEVFTPIKEYISPSGRKVFEFNQNLAGYLSFEIEAHKGEEIDVYLGEMLDENKEVTLKNIQCNTKGKLSPLQEVHLICKEGKNVYHPKFMYAGFKYASFSTTKIKKENVHQIALYTSMNISSKFNCSNELINIFEKNTLWSLKSNSLDVPTDCPTRERMGWTGDSQVFFNTASYLVNYAPFSRKHLEDVFDRQFKNGCLPQIAPYNAEDWYMNVMNGSVGWADVGVLTPYRFYQKYGDIRILTTYYDRMVKYANFMIHRMGMPKGIYFMYARPLHLSKKNKKFGVNTGQSYGEWAEPNDVKAFVWTDFCEPHPEESMAYTYFILNIMNEIGELIGRNENKERFTYYANGVKRAYQELVTKDNFTLDTDRQCKLVRPLYMNLLDEKGEKFAKERLIKALNHYSWRLGTGFLSTPLILDVLTSIDKEYAYRLLENEEMPGWLYMAKNNTGTIWEGWEGPNSQQGISSLNHYSKGAMVEWLYHSMCGINVDGENHFTLKPIIGGKENYASGEYKSIYGLVKLSWEKKNGKVIIDIDVPSNCNANFEYNGFKDIINYGHHHYEF